MRKEKEREDRNMKDKKIVKCVFCKKELGEHERNDIYPWIIKSKKGFCCNECNAKYVIPMRTQDNE